MADHIREVHEGNVTTLPTLSGRLAAPSMENQLHDLLTIGAVVETMTHDGERYVVATDADGIKDTISSIDGALARILAGNQAIGKLLVEAGDGVDKLTLGAIGWLQHGLNGLAFELNEARGILDLARPAIPEVTRHAAESRRL